MSTGMARGAAGRGKRIAFGDGKRIIWGPWSEPMFRYNPNIARPGEERAADLEWIAHYKGHRLYNRVSGRRWIWNMDFRPIAGEMFFDAGEQDFADKFEPGFVLIEPNLPQNKSVAPNKDWGFKRYRKVADRLLAEGRKVVQFSHGANKLPGATFVAAPDFRKALAVLSRAALYIGPEGGLHHGAAAVNVPGVVLFGGFIPPGVTGYSIHTNLTGGSVACGSLNACPHCRAALDAISVDEVHAAALRYLEKGTA